MSVHQQMSAGASHRERLIAGLAASIRERGYRDTKITDIVGHARTSRRSFYEQFEDRDACFLALHDTLGKMLIAAVEAGVDPGAPLADQVDQALGAYLEAITAEPELMVSAIRELPGLGAKGSAFQREGIEDFAALLMRLVNTDALRRAGVEPISLETAIMLVGGLRELVAHIVESGGDLATVLPAASPVFKRALTRSR